MIKRKLKLAGAFLAVAGAFCLASCGSNSSADNQSIVNSTDNINDKAEEKQKYVIELNMDNYQKYIDIKFAAASGSSNYVTYYFEGSLSYAFYDNVVITSHYYRSGYEETDTDIALSTGGYARWYATGYGTYTITAVSGKVIYWI